MQDNAHLCKQIVIRFQILEKKNFYSEYDEYCMFIPHLFKLYHDLSAFFIEIYSGIWYNDRKAAIKAAILDIGYETLDVR